MLGRYLIPIVFWTPDGSLKGMREGVAMQADIQSTVMSYLGYDKPFVSFGCDLLTTPDEDTFAFYDALGTYYYCRDGYVLSFNLSSSLGLYTLDDLSLSDNLLDREPERRDLLERQSHAYVQQLFSRIIHNEMVLE